MIRRRTLAISAAAAVTAALTLAACSSSGSNSTASGGSSTAAASGGASGYNAGLTSVVNPSDKKGGSLSFALSSTPDSLDPGNTYYAWTWNFSRLYGTPLIAEIAVIGRGRAPLSGARVRPGGRIQHERCIRVKAMAVEILGE